MIPTKVEITKKGGNMTEEVKRQTLSVEDLKSKNYISMKVGDSAEFVIDRIEKVPASEDFALSKADYRYEITTSEGKVLSVSSWKLWGAIREALKDQEQLEGSKISVIHTGHGEYSVSVVQ